LRMNRIDGLENMPELKGSVVTDGMFDGVHLGHQQILQKLIQEAKKFKVPSVLVTYWPHPRHVLSPKQEKLQLLTSLNEKAEILQNQGLDYLLVLPFTHKFSQISHIQFVEDILVGKLHTQKLIVGYDHHFGKDRLGNMDYLRSAGLEFGFDVQQIGKQEVEDIAISSTKIRYALKNHLIETAAQFLGRPYGLLGKVVEGDKKGRTIGFPTANLEPDYGEKLIPADGVYATRIWMDGQPFSAMTNIGFRPTVNGKTRRIETHLIDFKGDLYGKTLKLEFIAPIRDEIKFSSLDELKEQLQHDQQMALKLLF
jgi:riboflavin kinase/FMN adenylyltransferase